MTKLEAWDHLTGLFLTNVIKVTKYERLNHLTNFSLFFFFLNPTFRDLYTIFSLTKSAKKVRLLFLRGLEARRGFFEEMDFRLKYHHCTSPGGFTG